MALFLDFIKRDPQIEVEILKKAKAFFSSQNT
jgi:hypothetical protein